MQREKMEVLYDRLYEEEFLKHTYKTYNGLDLLVTIGDIHIYRIGKTTFEIHFGKFHQNVYSIKQVIDVLKTDKQIQYYLTH